MGKDTSVFAREEVFIARGEKVDFSREVRIITTSEKPSPIEILRTAEQLPVTTTNTLQNGLFVRTVYLPKGSTLIGMAHKTDHINICCGDITVTTPDGLKRFTGYHIIPALAGHKRAGTTHEDTVWSTICRTTKTELADIEDELVEEAENLLTRRQANLGCAELNTLLKD